MQDQEIIDRAPYGFRWLYGGLCRAPASPETLSDILALVAVEVTADELRRWPKRQRVAAEAWAQERTQSAKRARKVAREKAGIAPSIWDND